MAVSALPIILMPFHIPLSTLHAMGRFQCRCRDQKLVLDLPVGLAAVTPCISLLEPSVPFVDFGGLPLDLHSCNMITQRRPWILQSLEQ